MEQQQQKMIVSSSNVESEVTMTSEEGLAAKKPIADVLENEDSANTSQIAEKTNTADATDVLELEIEHESSSSEEEEVPEESSEDPISEFIVQDSLKEDDRIAEYNDNKNNEEGISPEKASIGVNPRSLVGTEPDIRRENRVLAKLLRAPRYFDPPECSWLECDKFDEINDKGEKGKSTKKRKPCYICGDIGHDGKRCRKVNACFICSKKGHLVIDCPIGNVEEDCTSRLCLLCGNTGHDMFSCSNDYDPEDLKHIQCYICKEFGHLCCVDSKTEGATEASCYNCGQSGHLGLECTKLNEVANDLQSVPLCPKSGERGHSPKETSLKIEMEKDAAATTKSAKRKTRRGKKTKPRPTSIASQSQPNRAWRPQIVGPYYGKPGSNVWLSPAAAAAAAKNSLNQQARAWPSRPPINHTPVPHGFFDPPTQLPHLYWKNSQNGIQFPQPALNQETGTMLPQTEIRIPQPALNQETGILLPQTETQTPQNSFCPMMQLPRLIWDSKTGTQIPQEPLSHQTVILLPQTGTQIPQQPFNHQTGILLPHQLVHHQPIALPPCQNTNNQTGSQTLTSSPNVLVSNPSSASS